MTNHGTKWMGTWIGVLAATMAMGVASSTAVQAAGLFEKNTARALAPQDVSIGCINFSGSWKGQCLRAGVGIFAMDVQITQEGCGTFRTEGDVKTLPFGVLVSETRSDKNRTTTQTDQLTWNSARDGIHHHGVLTVTDYSRTTPAETFVDDSDLRIEGNRLVLEQKADGILTTCSYEKQ